MRRNDNRPRRLHRPQAEIDTMLERSRLSDEHSASPDDINWGHVGTLAHYAELLKRITDAPSRRRARRIAAALQPRPARSGRGAWGSSRAAMVVALLLMEQDHVTLVRFSTRRSHRRLPASGSLRVPGHRQAQGQCRRQCAQEPAQEGPDQRGPRQARRHRLAARRAARPHDARCHQGRIRRARHRPARRGGRC